MKVISKMLFRHMMSAAAVPIVLLLTAEVGLAGGPTFTTTVIIDNALPELFFDADSSADPSIEVSAANDRLEFEHTNGSQFMSAELATGQILFGNGNNEPERAFHFRPTADGSDAAILVDNGNAANVVPRNMFDLRNNGAPRFVLRDTNNSRFYIFAMNPTGNFKITRGGMPGEEFLIKKNGVIEMGPGKKISFRVTGNGVLATNYGMLSDLEAKTDIQELTNEEVLSKIKQVPVSSWRLKGKDNSSRHIGPMAQDFREAFGTGTSDRVINVGDLAGVALAGVKSVTEELEARDAEVRELRQQLNEERSRSSELEERIGRLERLLKINQM